MNCANCGSPVASTDKFCPKCGAGMQTLGTGMGGAVPVPAQDMGAVSTIGREEDKGRRVVAFLIDIIPALCLAVLNLLPFIGHFAGSAVSAAYWLLRDITGSSPGKMVLGSVVVQMDGSPSTTGQRILRNLTLAIPGIIASIPFVGVFVAAPIGLIAFIGEVVMLLATGRRVGDILAGTKVVRKVGS